MKEFYYIIIIIIVVVCFNHPLSFLKAFVKGLCTRCQAVGRVEGPVPSVSLAVRALLLTCASSVCFR